MKNPIEDIADIDTYYDNEPVWGGSDSTCSNCRNWEPRQNSGMGDGYCPIFDKFTDPDHGKHCTAFQLNTLNDELSILDECGLDECRDICHRIYIARNITMNADEIEEQMRRIDRLLREPNWN